MKPTSTFLPKKSLTFFCLLAISMLLTLNLAAQTVHTVDNRPESGAQFTSIQAAVDAAVAGDIIYIHPSPTGYGNVTVDKTLKLVGPGHNPANSGGLRASIGIIYLGADSLDTVITGLDIDRVDGYSFATNSSGIHIINNRFAGSSVSIYGFNNGTQSPNWVIEGNLFDTSYTWSNVDTRGNQDWIIQNNIFRGVITNPNRNTVITNNIFINSDPSGLANIISNSNDITSPIFANNIIVITDPDVTTISNTGSTPVVYTNCLTYNTAGATLTDLSGSGNVNNSDPLFNSIPTSIVNYYENDYSLGAGSPGIGLATDGGDVGVFGRNFPYDINGRPHSMPYPELMTILNTVVQPGQNLSVQFQASQKN